MNTPDLTKEIKGVPLWGWLAVGAVALYVVYRMRKKASAADAENETVAEDGGYYGEGGYVYTGGATGGNALPEITADDLEGIAAQLEGIGAGIQSAIEGGFAGISDQLEGVTDSVENIEWPDYPTLPEQPADPDNPTGEPPGGGPGSQPSPKCPIGYEPDGKGNCVKKRQAGGGHKCPKGTTWDASRGGCVPIKLPVGTKVPVVPPRDGKGDGKGKDKEKVTNLNGKGTLGATTSQPEPVKTLVSQGVTGGGTVAPPPIKVSVTDIVTSKPERKPAVYEPPRGREPVPTHKPAINETFNKVLPPKKTGNPKGR